jgi:hypothetical protein
LILAMTVRISFWAAPAPMTMIMNISRRRVVY